jgi:hypothetical protein
MEITMKEFLPTYLYIKTHNVTGLKYFGKTTNDPTNYRGSGTYWTDHIKKHGYDCTTEILGFFTDKEECTQIAIKFSQENDIVNSVDINKKKIWANLVEENGLDGGKTYEGPRPQWVRDKLKEIQKNLKPSDKKIQQSKINLAKATRRKAGEWKFPEASKEKLRNANLGKKASEETREKLRNKRHSADAKKRISASLTGRPVSAETRNKISSSQKGKIVSEETKQKIREKRATQIFTDATKQKLSGKVIVVDSTGTIIKITKEEFYSDANQTTKKYVFHNSAEGKLRKLNKDA